jgi:hypothetical protein
MKGKLIGAVVLLIGSEAIGILFGRWFFRTFNQTVPPAVMTSYNKATAQALYFTTGLGAGFVIFLWCLAAIAVSASFWRRKGSSAPAAP